MNFYGIRELSNNTKNVITSVNQNGSAVITDNGKPAALMISISEENFEATLDAIRQMRARQAVDALRKQARMNFPEGMSMDEIDAEIDAARKGV